MSTTWFAKIDCNFHANRKAIKAGLLGRAVFVHVLCVNAQKGAPGIISAEDIELWYVARELQITEQEAKRGIDACIAAELIEIEDGLVSICGWTEDYAKYPLTSSEKQKAYRDRVKKRKLHPPIVTTVTDHGNAGSNGVTPVTQEGRKEGREGERALAPTGSDFDPADAAKTGALARQTWSRLSEIRTEVARELGLSGVLPLTAITPASANQPGFRNLMARIHDEGPNAPAVCTRVLEVLTVQARKTRSIEWLSEKAFTEGGWRTARESVPSWRGKPPAHPAEAQVFVLDDGATA